jgi:hypothetical protein
MSYPSRFLYLVLNLAYGASIGAAAALGAHQQDAWTDGPSTALLVVGTVVVFGAAYLLTVTLRGQRPALRGVLTAGSSAVGVFTISTLAVSAPAWVLVWTGAALIGLAAGLLQPLPSRRRTAA